MKKKIIISFGVLFFLFITYIAFLFISATISTSKNQSKKEYLSGLQDHYLLVISELKKQDISANYEDKRKELIIDSSEANYYFSSEGAIFISTEYGFITTNFISDNGKIEKIDIYVGDSTGSTHNRYNRDDLNEPNAYYFGDDVKSADKIIKKYLPNEKIEALISQSEKYQEIIKESIHKKH